MSLLRALLQRFLGSIGEPLNAAAAVASSGLSWFVLLNLKDKPASITAVELYTWATLLDA